jgi:hypothetical protein
MVASVSCRQLSLPGGGREAAGLPAEAGVQILAWSHSGEGDPVDIRAVAVTPDGIAWFASGEAESWRGRIHGLASWDGRHFTCFDPMVFGAVEYNILEIQALADGCLVLGFPRRACWSGAPAIAAAIG